MTLTEGRPAPTAAATTASPTLLPLTGAQLGIWNAQRLEPDSPYYLVGEVLEIDGSAAGVEIDLAVLIAEISATVTEAETMRLRFVETEDGPRQWIAPGESLSIPVVDLGDEENPHAAADETVPGSAPTPPVQPATWRTGKSSPTPCSGCRLRRRCGVFSCTTT